MSAEEYLDMFEEAINAQIDLVGQEKAHDQARRAGLTVSAEGHISSCTGHPMVVLLRLVRIFTEDNNMKALEKCMPLINKMEQIGDIVEQHEQKMDA